MTSPIDSHSRRITAISVFAATLLALLAIAWFAYRPGLSGAFLFDDLGSLPKLGATGPVDNWATFWRYITSGTADPTGRPLTLLTFLIDARNWPASPYPFKVTSVILHLINGALLAWVLWWLGKALVSCRSACDDHPVVIPGLSEGQDPTAFAGLQTRTPKAARSASATDGASQSVLRRVSSRTTRVSERVENHQTDSGSPLRGVRNDEKSFKAARRDEAGSRPGRLNETSIVIAALFGAGAWLLHPLLVSTTLYIVQREAMLPATFVLVALLGWMASREALARGHVKRALIGMALSSWLCTVLAVLSKANGALLPLLLLLVDWIVLAPRKPMPTADTLRWYKRAVTVFLIIPGILLIAYLLSLLPGIVRTTPGIRGWTVGQRLLTEPRVLTDYLRLLFVPHAHSSGLFNDAFQVSTGWLHPGSTIPCVILILALIAAGFALRRKYPAIALALLFYFTAQLMESGWIPLELYFEHRNYLPAMLLFWPIGLALGQPGALRFLRVLAVVLILAVLAGLTAQRAALWGDAPRQARVWAAINPDSARAQTSAALYDLQSHRPRLASARLRLAVPKHPDDLQIPVNLVTAECRLGVVQPGTLAAARTALANDRKGGKVAFNWFGEALSAIGKHACRGLDYADMQTMLGAARRNPWWRDRAGMTVNLYHLEGTLNLAQHRPQLALRNFDLALHEAPNPGAALAQAATLAAAGYPDLGLEHLDYFDTLPRSPRTGFSMSRIHAWVLRKQGYWHHELAHLRTEIKASVPVSPIGPPGV